MSSPVTLLGLLLAAEIAIGAGVFFLLWRRIRARLDAHSPLQAPGTPPAPPPPPREASPAPPPAAPRPPQPTLSAPPPAFVLPDMGEDEEIIEDARSVVPVQVTLVWGVLGKPLERYGVRIDSVARDTLVFGGEAKRLDVIQIVPMRRLFHTMQLPHERLLAAHDADDQPIENIRKWLAALPEAQEEASP